MTAKKLTAIVLTLFMSVGLVTGCGTSDSKTSASNSDAKTENQSETENKKTEENSDTATDLGKTLVVYYSATGNTKGVAETIADVTGGDLFEIEPKEPYTDEDLDWTNDDSRVSREHDDESLA